MFASAPPPVQQTHFGGFNTGGDNSGFEGFGGLRVLAGATLTEKWLRRAVARRWVCPPLTVAEGDGSTAMWAPESRTPVDEAEAVEASSGGGEEQKGRRTAELRWEDGETGPQ